MRKTNFVSVCDQSVPCVVEEEEALDVLVTEYGHWQKDNCVFLWESPRRTRLLLVYLPGRLHAVVPCHCRLRRTMQSGRQQRTGRRRPIRSSSYSSGRQLIPWWFRRQIRLPETRHGLRGRGGGGQQPLHLTHRPRDNCLVLLTRSRVLGYRWCATN